jgi:hypothetical protein
MRIRCRGNPFTEQLPDDSLGIVDAFTGHYSETGVCLSTYCITTAVLVAHFEVPGRQRFYTPQYQYILDTDRTENTASNSSSIVTCMCVVAITWRLLNHCLVTGVLTEPFHNNGWLCWFHNSSFKQKYHSINFMGLVVSHNKETPAVR